MLGEQATTTRCVCREVGLELTSGSLHFNTSAVLRGYVQLAHSQYDHRHSQEMQRQRSCSYNCFTGRMTLRVAQQDCKIIRVSRGFHPEMHLQWASPGMGCDLRRVLPQAETQSCTWLPGAIAGCCCRPSLKCCAGLCCAGCCVSTRRRVAQGAVAGCCCRAPLQGAATGRDSELPRVLWQGPVAGCCGRPRRKVASCRVLLQGAAAECCCRVLLQAKAPSCAGLLQAETQSRAGCCCRALLQNLAAGRDSEWWRVLLQGSSGAGAPGPGTAVFPQSSRTFLPATFSFCSLVACFLHAQQIPERLLCHAKFCSVVEDAVLAVAGALQDENRESKDAWPRRLCDQGGA